MPDRLSDERLAEIRDIFGVRTSAGQPMSLASHYVNDLLAEVERLRKRNDDLEEVYRIASEWLASDAEEVGPDWQLADAVAAAVGAPDTNGAPQP